jgi:hypothetical protein
MVRALIVCAILLEGLNLVSQLMWVLPHTILKLLS